MLEFKNVYWGSDGTTYRADEIVDFGDCGFDFWFVEDNHIATNISAPSFRYRQVGSGKDNWKKIVSEEEREEVVKQIKADLKKDTDYGGTWCIYKWAN